MAGASEKWATGNGPAMLGRAFAVLTFVMSTIAALAAGCGADSQQPAGTGGNGMGQGTGGSTSSIPGACAEGATQECHVTLSKHGSVITCYAGTQTCEGGLWGDCAGGAEFHRFEPGVGSAERRDPGADQGDTLADPGAPVFHSLSLSDAGACLDAGFNDPCDPTCMGYPEVPDGGISITGTGNPGWQTGGINAFPLGLQSKGLKNPCYTASDCQFNRFCGNPATNPACSHDKCAPGAPLIASCDTCVQQICAKPANAACCASATCGHDLCTVGTKLTNGCDPCVTSICATMPSCCTTAWTAACAAAVTTTCSQTCSSWSPACVKEVHDTCGDVCKTPKATCTHDICDTGEQLVNSCDNGVPGGNCVASICAARPSCCTTAWDSTCTTMVNSTCLKACEPKGICDPWLAGQTDANCPKADLTIGPPCVIGKIPVCNVGTVTAVPPPGGIVVYHWPGASGQMPTCSPNLAAGTACPAIMVPIPPGQCVTVICPLAGNEELMVNPTGTVSECTCQNNWSLYSAANNCEPVVCTGPQTNFNNTLNVIHIGVERSSATATAIPAAGTVLSQIRTGVLNFYTNPVNAGSRSSLTFFPDSPTPDCTTTTCTTATSCTPRVTQALISNATFQTSVQTALMGATSAAGGPPTSAAYDGMLATATPLTTTYPTAVHLAVLILASDVANCDPSVSAMVAKAATALATYRIRTFVIGIGVPAATTAAIASAGGGEAFDLLPIAALGTNLTTTLNTIRLTLPKCSYPLPEPGLYDPLTPVLGYISGIPAMNVPQTKVANLAACGGGPGWYYDNNLNPTQAILCPALCTTFRGAINTAIKLTLKCPTKYAPWSSAPQTYQGTCPPGTQVQWSHFGYNASALSDSSIVFTAQVAAKQADLAMAPVIQIATARSTPTDTQVCPVPKIPAQMPVPTCAPIDLYAKLGGVPEARYDFLKLSMAFNPNTLQTVTPTIVDWQLTYSCVADQ